MNKRSMAAVKANVTRKARKQFRELYPETWRIARDLMQGYDTESVAWSNVVSVRTVAAVLANLSRECRFASLARQCNF